MWVCPNCGRSFQHAHQWHSCATASLESHLAGKTAQAVALFHAFQDAVAACELPFEAAPTKTLIVYRAARAFASVAVRKRWLDVELRLPRLHEDARVRNVLQISSAGFAHKVRIAEPADLDRTLRDWICAACAHAQEAER